MKLFFDLEHVQNILNFKEKNTALFEKIDKLDWNKLDYLIEDTKYNKDNHDWLFNSFDAIKDWLWNWILLWAKKYETLFTQIFDWNPYEAMSKMFWNISQLVEEIWLWDFLKLIAWNLYDDFKKMLDFDQPTYKIAQTAWKFLLDVIIQLISGWAWIVWKLAKIIDKIIPDWMLKNWIELWWKIIWESIWIKSQKLKLWEQNFEKSTSSNFLSRQSMKETWIKWEASRLTNELMYYWWATPYIIYNELRKWKETVGNLVKWAKETNKELAKNWYKIQTENLMTAITPNWDTVVKMVKLEKKINPETKIAKEAIKYLNIIEKGLEKININKLNIAIKLTGKSFLWEKRIHSYQENPKNDPDIFKDLISNLEKKYLNKKEENIA